MDNDILRSKRFYSICSSTWKIIFNLDIKPESTTSWETGFEALLFKKRLSLDFTVYQQSTKNQIFELPNDITTGYSRRVVNGGEIENRGIEIAVIYSPIKNKRF